MQLTLDGTRFRFDGRLTYDDNADTHVHARGLLMNARFIQGLFNDTADPARFARFGHDTYDPDAQTDRLIRALPEWHAAGLRALTVGLQGGGPCFTTPNPTIDNNPFSPDGADLDPGCVDRLDRLVRAADGIGMAVIVSFLYGAQTQRLDDDCAVERAVVTASRLLRDRGYANVIIEVANEYDVGAFRSRPIVHHPYGMARLIDAARRESGGLPVGCSGVGGSIDRPVVDASDVVLIHGNGLSRMSFHNLLRQARAWAPDKPVVCNEDSPAISNLSVAVREQASWGYYNNWSKQEPPTDFSILPGHDRYFAWRTADAVGYRPDPIPDDQRFFLHGLREHETSPSIRDLDRVYRWPGLACLFPELVDRVEFSRDGQHVETCYDDPFAVGWKSNWFHAGHPAEPGTHHWRATAHLRDGSTVTREAEAELA